MHPVGNCFPKKNHVLLSNFFPSSNMFFIRLVLANTWNKNGGSPCSFKRKGDFFRYWAYFEGNLLRFACARARVHALMTRKSCAVGMRNAILRNYLKLDRNTVLAWAVDVMMAWAKRIYILNLKVVFLFFIRLFSKRKRKHVLLVSIELWKPEWKFGKAWKNCGTFTRSC